MVIIQEKKLFIPQHKFNMAPIKPMFKKNEHELLLFIIIFYC